MKHEFIDHHRQGNSLIHKADPRVKILILVIYILTVVSIPYSAERHFAGLALIPVFFALLSGISFFHYLSKLIKIYPMIFFITFLLPFFPANGGAVHHFWIFNIYEQGLQKFVLINLKASLTIFMSIILTTTTDFTLLLHALEKFRIPQVIIVILSFMYRFIFLLIDEAERMIMAFQSRYIRLSLWQRLKYVAQEIGVLFIRTYERGERIYQAMESRGFNGSVNTLSELEWRFSDSVLLFIFTAVILLSFKI